MRYFLLLFIFLLNISCQSDKELLYALIEEGEQFPGGAVTTEDLSMNAFGHAAPNLKDGKDMDFVTGNAFFKRNWVTSPSSTKDLDGLGPLFNARSCSSCHEFDGKGAPSTMALLFRLSTTNPSENITAEPSYGGQFNHLSITGVKPEGEVVITYDDIPVLYPDGTTVNIRKPDYTFKELNYGSFAESTMISPRIATHMVGLGLLEAISEEDLLALQDENDEDNNGISGRINYIYDLSSQSTEVGRFGWKANQPSVKQQVAAAFLGDIGITSSLYPNEACADSQQDCISAYQEDDPELSDDILQRVTLYSQSLAVPKRRAFNADSILRGKKLFMESGCVDCHVPTFITAEHPTIDAFSNQKIFPYTDLLLHDMGDGLADNRPDGLAGGREWKTPPLWGIGLSEVVNGHSFLLHDGRARNVEEAILWHDGEAKNSMEAFKKLVSSDRKKLIDFVNSL